jgi:hypothetical protein
MPGRRRQTRVEWARRHQMPGRRRQTRVEWARRQPIPEDDGRRGASGRGGTRCLGGDGRRGSRGRGGSRYLRTTADARRLGAAAADAWAATADAGRVDAPAADTWAAGGNARRSGRRGELEALPLPRSLLFGTLSKPFLCSPYRPRPICLSLSLPRTPPSLLSAAPFARSTPLSITSNTFPSPRPISDPSPSSQSRLRSL